MMQSVSESVVTELQPIIDAIAACRSISITLPVTEGKTVVVSVQTNDHPKGRISEAASRGLDARQLSLVDGAIREKISESISVSMLSSVAGLSRSYFSHAFRTSVGRTPHEYVVGARIERAMKLMRETDVPLSQIAVATGFSDQAHFSNLFRRAAGITPSRWRKLHCLDTH